MTALPRIDILNSDMMEATRLTREGRLDEAMAVLRGALAAAPASASASDCGSDARQGRPAGTPLALDFAPPSRATGAAWTLPPPSARAHPAGGSRDIRRPPVGDALRAFLDRNGGLGRSGLDGLAAPALRRAPVPVPDGARFEALSYASAAGSRPYKLYVPSGWRGQALPLVVMLHGCTQSPDDFAAGTRMNDVAEERMCLVAYPEQPRSANPSGCWNWFNAGDQQRDRGEPALIAGITRQVMRDYPVEAGRVYVAGLSAGGAAAAIMGAAYPDLYAAIGVHSGLACGAASDVASAFAAMRQGGPAGASHRSGARGAVPTIVFHGDRDATVHPVNGDRVIAAATPAAGLSASVSRGTAAGGISYTRTVHADDSGRAVLEQWLLHGAGHAWSGGSAAGSYTEPRGPDASREMMRFFLSQSSVTSDR
jgi:poly(hydroxyalkanoate) depolymerase family esterase